MESRGVEERGVSQEISSGRMPMFRTFTREGKSPFEFDIFGNRVNWLSEEVSFVDDKGKIIYTQQNVKRPDFWSPLAIKVVASKYFWGNQKKGERESNVEQLIGRVSRFIGRQAFRKGYFNEEQSRILRDEIASICLNQLCTFNSPVWFNAGIWEYNKEAGGVSTYKWDNKKNMAVRTKQGREVSGVAIEGEPEDSPQCSACFIQAIEDNIDSILAVQVAEVNLFKAGSGTGTDRSPLRSSKENLTGGGIASGPVSFMRGYDAYAGIIKSGGKTRRAAKMEILKVEHPDIMLFIDAKQKEEKKAWALIEQGYDGGLNGEAYGSIAFQNCNMSVRVNDEFMHAVKSNKEWVTKRVTDGKPCETLKAREIMRRIAEGTYICGDPGIQNDTIINKYHTCKNSGRINASNPCVTGDTKVLTKEGKWVRIDRMLGKEKVILTNTGVIRESETNGSFVTGRKPVYRLTTKSGYELKLTAEHKVFSISRGFVQACELTKDDYVLIPAYAVAEANEIEEDEKTFYQMLGAYLGDGSRKGENDNGLQITMHKSDEKNVVEKFAVYTSEKYERRTHKDSPATIQMTETSAKYTITNNLLKNRFSEMLNLNLYSHEKCISEQIFSLPLGAQKYVLQGLFTADGTVANYGEKSQYVALDSTSLQLLKDVQIILLGFGIKSKLYKNRRAGKLNSFLPNGKGGLKEYEVKEMHSLRISRSGRINFEKRVGFMPESYKREKLRKLNAAETETYKDYPVDAVKSLEYVGEETVYDLTEPTTHTFVANGITIHNCSEYMFLDDTACNLASINLLKFLTKDGEFDVSNFRKVVRYFITAMEIIVDSASYPTAKICEMSHIYRTLGLGYANLGALLMSLGLPYDSDEGRAVAASITAIMCGEAYKTSAELAGLVGAFPGYEENKEPMLDVIKMHREHVKDINVEKIPPKLRYLVNDAWDAWTEALELGGKNGYRNAQATVIAPTGTIAFMMDCDTTGPEPDIALVKYKVLAGGGMLKIVNRAVPMALRNLGYGEDEIKEIVGYIDKNDTIEGAPHLLENHLLIFDCAFKAANGERSIHYKGHIKMLSVIQPFISGAISKTINMPESSTVEEIMDAYIYAWEQGLKAVAIYRENSKRSQPLNTRKTEGEIVKRSVKERLIGERKRLPQTHKSLTHKFEISGHEGYLTIGIYDDGKPGEIFVTMHKQGSTIRGLIDAWATSVSLNLQYGASVKDLFGKFRHQKFEPAGFVKNRGGGEIDGKISQIKTASSIVDYVSQFMINNFGEGSEGVVFDVKNLNNEKEEQASLEEFQNEGITCPICGGVAKRISNCAIMCTSCNQTTRSGCGE